MKNKIRILIVDDHFVVRIGLLTSLKQDPGLSVVAGGEHGPASPRVVPPAQPDIVLMDLRLPDLNGIEATAVLRQEFPGARVIMISSYDAPEEIYRSFRAGAQGYLRKDVLGRSFSKPSRPFAAGQQYVPASIARALAEHAPGSDLTERETQVLQLLIKGLSNKEIGNLLHFSENTAKFHVKNILAQTPGQRPDRSGDGSVSAWTSVVTLFSFRWSPHGIYQTVEYRIAADIQGYSKAICGGGIGHNEPISPHAGRQLIGLHLQPPAGVVGRP